MPRSAALLLPGIRNQWAFRPLGPKGPVERFDEGIRTHCQLHPDREVQEDVSGLFIRFIHSWDESLTWSSIAVGPVFLPWLGFGWPLTVPRAMIYQLFNLDL
jgi:hypothetical protein